MAIFRRKDETGPAGGEPGPTTVPTSRDPDLAVPPFRPAASPTPPKPSAAPASPVITRPTTPTSPTMSMPRSTATRAETADRRTLVVGKGISVQGTVTDAERLVIEGTMESQLLQAHELSITHSGVFKGEVHVEDAEIAGLFDGSLTANGNLVIRATGRVLGTARCRRLQVEDGGQLSGKMEMITDAAPAAPQRSVSPPTPVAPPVSPVRNAETAEA